MENVKTIISRHNHRLLKRNPTQKPLQCDCQKPDECPLDGKCKVDNIVYLTNRLHFPVVCSVIDFPVVCSVWRHMW
jgi:hypothetical protein